MKNIISSNIPIIIIIIISIIIITSRFGARKCCLLGGFILVSGTFLSSIATSLQFLLFTNGILFGSGMGICYSAPIACAARHIPHRKGLLSGIIVSGFGGGAFVFGNIALNIINPSREGIPDTDSKEKYYDSDSHIANQVPKMFIILGMCYSVLILIGGFLLSDPPKEPIEMLSNTQTENNSKLGITRWLRGVTYESTQKEEIKDNRINFQKNSDYSQVSDMVNDDYNKIQIKNNGDNDCIIDLDGKENDDIESIHIDNKETIISEIDPLTLIRTPLAWHLASCITTTTIGGMYLCGSFKTYGQSSFNDESYLSTVASTSSIFSACGRIFWGALGDKIGVLESLICMCSIFACIIATYSMSSQYGKAGFAIWTFSIFFLEGGNFALYMPLTIETFGNKFSGTNYGIMYTCYSLFSVINITILANNNVRFNSASLINGLITFIGFVNLCFFRIHRRRQARRP
jgi:MFS family permease